MKQSLFWIWAPLGICAAFLIVAPALLTALTIGERLAVINPLLEPLLYVAILIGIYALALRPIVLALGTPELELTALEKAPYHAKMQVAQRVLKNPKLQKAVKDELSYIVIRGGMLDGPLRRAIEHLDETSQAIIDEKARIVFISNTIVQNGRLEAITLLMVNLRMVQDLIEHYGHRTSLRSMWMIYSEIFVTAFLVEKMDEMDLDSTLELVLSNSITEIPGFSYVVHSLIEGTTSALFTLRVGAIARDLLCNGVHDGAPRHARRVSANEQAFRRASAILPAATAELSKTLLQKAGNILGRNIFGIGKHAVPAKPAPAVSPEPGAAPGAVGSE